MKTEEEAILFYNEKISLFKQLLALTESVRDLAKKGETENIPARLKERQKIFARIKVIDEKFGLKNKIHESVFEEKISENKAQTLNFVKVIRKIIKTINDIDMETRILINREKEAVADELKKVSAGHNLIKKYVPSFNRPPAYFSMSA